MFKELKNGIEILMSQNIGFGSITQEPLGLP